MRVVTICALLVVGTAFAPEPMQVPIRWASRLFAAFFFVNAGISHWTVRHALLPSLLPALAHMAHETCVGRNTIFSWR